MLPCYNLKMDEANMEKCENLIMGMNIQDPAEVKACLNMVGRIIIWL